MKFRKFLSFFPVIGVNCYFLTDEKSAFIKNGSTFAFDCSIWIPTDERLVSAFW